MSRKVDAPKYLKCSLIHIWHNSVRHDLFQCLEFSACTILIAIQQILLYEIIVSYCMHTLCLPYIPVRNTCTKLAKKCRFTKYILLNDYLSKFLFQFCSFLLINKETNCCLCSINPTFNGGHPGKKLVCTKSIPLCIAKEGKHCLNQSKFFIVNGKGIFLIHD